MQSTISQSRNFVTFPLGLSFPACLEGGQQGLFPLSTSAASVLSVPRNRPFPPPPNDQAYSAHAPESGATMHLLWRGHWPHQLRKARQAWVSGCRKKAGNGLWETILQRTHWSHCSWGCSVSDLTMSPQGKDPVGSSLLPGDHPNSMSSIPALSTTRGKH